MLVDDRLTVVALHPAVPGVMIRLSGSVMFARRAACAFLTAFWAASSAVSARWSVAFAFSIRHGGGPGSFPRVRPRRNSAPERPASSPAAWMPQRDRSGHVRARLPAPSACGPQLAATLGLSRRSFRLIGRLSRRGVILGLDHLKRRAQPGQPTGRQGDLSDRLHARQPLRAGRSGLLILAGHRHQLPDLPPDPLSITVASKRRVGRDLRPIQRHDREIRQPRGRAQPQPDKTNPPAPAPDRPRTARSSRDQAPAHHRSPETPHPSGTPPRSAARTAPHSNTRTTTTPPASPAHTADNPDNPPARCNAPVSSSATTSSTNHARCPSSNQSRIHTGTRTADHAAGTHTHASRPPRTPQTPPPPANPSSSSTTS